MPTEIELSGARVKIKQHPDYCPICRRHVIPEPVYINPGKTEFFKAELEVLYLCPNSKCGEVFIAYFDRPTYTMTHPDSGIFLLKTLRPFVPATLEFSKHIRETSPSFCEIYNEAHTAEQYSLSQICGCGYRKSLEFLIKDYVIQRSPSDKTRIETIMLGPCIENYVTDQKIKDIAKRATWLGNDETHYQRRWADKDLSDLKVMISLTLHWIEAEYLTEEALRSMPAPGTS
jgi:hypothetical protein